MSLHRLLFDPANPVESSNVGANLRSGMSGALLTSHSLTQAASGAFNFVDADVTPASDTIAETAHGFQTGKLVQLTTTGTLPAGLALATDYYVIRVDANTVKLAASASDAELGIAVDITAAAGGGTHTMTGFEMQVKALDVNVMNAVAVSGAVTVSATDLDIRDLVFATDKVDVSGSSNVAVTDGGGSLTVDAVNLDIRDLAFATDKVDVSGSSVSISGTVAVTQSTSPWVVSATDLDIRDLAFATDKVDVSGSSNVAVTDGGGSLTVDAVNLDIRDLAAATDSVSAWTKDGSGNAITSTGGALDVNVTNSIDVDDGLANTAIAAEAKNISTSGAAVTSVLASRKYLSFYNNGSKPVYFGPSGVSIASGFPLFPGAILETRIGAAVAVHAVAQSGTQEIRTLQAS